MVSFLEKNKKIILSLLLLLSIFLITFRFTNVPKVWEDEGVFTEVARNLVVNKTLALQVSPDNFFSMRNLLLTTGYPVIFPISFSFYLFDIGMIEARVVMLLYMFLLVIGFYLFNYKKYGTKEALLGVLLLLSFSPFYGNGRSVLGEVPGLALFTLGLFFLFFFEKSGFLNKKFAFISGLFLALSAAVKPIFLVLIPVSILVSLFIGRKNISFNKIFFYSILGYLVPMILWIFVHFPNLSSFKKAFSTFLYLSGTHNESESVFNVVLQNFLRFFTEVTPILFTIIFSIILLSFILKKYKNYDFNLSLSDFVALIFIILNIVGYLKGTGWYRYFFPAHVLVYLLLPGAYSYLRSLTDGIYKRALDFSIILLVILQFFHLAFFSDTAFVTKMTRNQNLSEKLSIIDPSKSILFYNSVEAIIFYKSKNYSQYLGMDDFLVAGDINSYKDTSFDYILTSNKEDVIVSSSCYDSEEFNNHILYKKKIDSQGKSCK